MDTDTLDKVRWKQRPTPIERELVYVLNQFHIEEDVSSSEMFSEIYRTIRNDLFRNLVWCVRQNRAVSPDKHLEKGKEKVRVLAGTLHWFVSACKEGQLTKEDLLFLYDKCKDSYTSSDLEFSWKISQLVRKTTQGRRHQLRVPVENWYRYTRKFLKVNNVISEWTIHRRKIMDAVQYTKDVFFEGVRKNLDDRQLKYDEKLIRALTNAIVDSPTVRETLVESVEVSNVTLDNENKVVGFRLKFNSK